MDLTINKKEKFIREWFKICLHTSKDYIYVLDEDMHKVVTDYSDLVYEEIINSKNIFAIIENVLKDKIKSVIVNEETALESNRILAEILLYELNYTYQEGNNIWVKRIYTAEDYYSYLLNLTIDGDIGYHLEEINEGSLELTMDFYDCGEFYPRLIVSNNDFNNVVPLFPKQDKEKSTIKNNSWDNYNNVKLQIPNGPRLKPNKTLENMVSKILINHKMQEELNI